MQDIKDSKVNDIIKDENYEDISDYDLCDAEHITSLFNLNCDLKAEEIVDEHNKYVLFLSGTLENTSNIILGLSNDVVKIYNLSNNQLGNLNSFDVGGTVIGVKTSSDNSNLFYVGTSNCNIKLYDIRTPNNFVSCFKDTTLKDDEGAKPLSCFDVCPNNLFLAGGTDLYQADAYIIFWDIRNVKILGAYWDSHKDDITQVKFHPNDTNKLISGSTDGLINVYDLSQTSEYNALIDSLNTESSVEQLFWCPSNNGEIVYCTTHTSDLQLWKMEDVAPYIHLLRGDITKQLKRKTGDYTYVATVHMNKNNQLFCLFGSNYQEGECLRGFSITGDKIVPAFDFKQNKQIVRCSWFNENTNILVTGGEKSILNVWKLNTSFENSSKKKTKNK